MQSVVDSVAQRAVSYRSPGWCRMRLTGLLVAACLAGCAVRPITPPNLYQRLGGTGGLMLIVDEALARSLTDERIAARFEGVETHQLKRLMVAQLCQRTGGGCQYLGRDMRRAHEGRGIRGREFEAFLQHVSAAMERFRVPRKEQEELLALLEKDRRDVIVAR